MQSLQRLHRDSYRRWARISAWVTLAGYATVLTGNVVLQPERRLDIATQVLTVVLAGVALFLIARLDRVTPGVLLIVAAVWIDLHVPVFFRGLEPSSLVVVPALVGGVGLVLGGAGAYAMAAASGVTNAVAAVVAHRWFGVPNPDPAGEVYLLLVATASYLVIAAFVHLGVRAFGQVLEVARRNEDRVAELVDQTPLGMVALGPGGEVLSANPAAQAVLGFGEQELAGRPFRTTLRGLVRDPEGRREIDRLLDEGADGDVTLALSRGRQDLAWARLWSRPAQWAGVDGGSQVLIEDVTERRRSEEDQRLLRLQLEHAQRLEALGRLAGGVAHDFNNLLTAVGGSAEMLMEEDDEEVRELARHIYESKERGSALVRQLLAFARKEIVRPETLSLGRVVQEARPLLERILGESVDFEMELAPEVPPVVADHAQVEQVLVNLVSNAKDATGPGGCVRISVQSAGRQGEGEPDMVELAVADDGVGMDPEVRRRACEPFFTTKPRGRGTGLGLATVHGIVNQNGGRLELESQVGEGTRVATFWRVDPA